MALLLTPQARRRIGLAVEALQADARDRWEAWAQEAEPNAARSDVPYEIAAIAIEALGEAQRDIEQQLGQEAVADDQRADLSNDLGYIQAIKTALHTHIQRP